MAVADGDLHGLHAGARAVGDQHRMEGACADQGFRGRQCIAQPAEPSLDLRRHGLCELRAEADARDVEEKMAVDLADIDRADDTGADRARRGLDIVGDAERAREIVGRSRGQDAERKTGCDEAARRRVQRPVAAGKDHAIGLRLPADDQVGEVAGAFAFVPVEGEPGGIEMADRGRERLAPAPALTIDDEERAAADRRRPRSMILGQLEHGQRVDLTEWRETSISMEKDPPPVPHPAARDQPASPKLAGDSAEAAQHREGTSEIGDRVGAEDEAAADPDIGG